MFIYSMKASTLKFCGVICVCLIALVALISFIPVGNISAPTGLFSNNTENSIQYDKIKTNEDRIAFLKQFGWEVTATPLEEQNITIPSEFDKVFTGYNELQKKQGLDLSKYKKKDMVRYTYQITNYSDYDGTVYANILVYKNKVVGGDICSSDISGFVHGFSQDVTF